jgi:glyoxylase I family protein
MSAAFFHVGLTVSDIERSLRFYLDVVGLDEAYQTVMETEAFDRLTNNRGTKIRVAGLTAGAFMLQLVEYVSGGGKTLDLEHRNVGNPHLSFYCDDPPALRKRLEQRGDVNITSEIVEINPGQLSFYVADPDGVPVEFIQRRSE